MTDRLSSFLDTARWLAALAVVVSHVRHLLLVDYAAVAQPVLPLQALYFLTGFGHEAVVVFFVISGYLVGGSTLARLPERGFDLGQFTIHRVSRIYTVLIPALLVGGLFDLLGLRLWNASGLYTGLMQSPNPSIGFSVADNFGVLTLFGNLAMTGGFLVPRFGSNAPLWSLVYEWWYYCLFAAAIGGFALRGRNRALCLVALLAMLPLVPAQILLWGAIWLLGVVAHAYAQRSLPRPNRWMGLIVFALIVAFARISHAAEASGPDAHMGQFMLDLAVGLAFALALVAWSGAGRALPLPSLQQWAAGFSFSLYLTHFPLLLVLAAFANDVFAMPLMQQPGPVAIAWFGLVTAIVVAFGWLFSLVTEAHTGRVRCWLSRRLAGQTPARAVVEPTATK